MLCLLVILFVSTPVMAESWNFIFRDDLGSYVKTVEIQNEKIYIQDYSSYLRQSSVVVKDGINTSSLVMPKTGLTRVDDMLNWKNSIYVSAEFGLYKYSNEKWKHYTIDDRFKDFRITVKTISFEDKIYCLSRALDLKGVDSTNNIIRTYIDSTFIELSVLENDKLNIIFQEGYNDLGRFRDMYIDKDGTFWFAESPKEQGGLAKYNGDEIASIDIASYINSDVPVFSNITGSDKYIYITNERVLGGEKKYNSQLVRYNKQNGDIDVYDFPEYIDDRRFDQVEKLEYLNGKVYMATNVGIFIFENEEIKYLDIFADFMDEIVEETSKLQLQYLEASDFDIDGNKFYIATSVGLIYSDNFTTGIDDEQNSEDKINVYPNVLESGNNTITLEAQNIGYNISSIEVYNTGGSLISNVSSFPLNLTGKEQIELPEISSGAYFLIIKSDRGDFLAPIIIKN